jgi:cell wall-associated NlpC family hydrolase
MLRSIACIMCFSTVTVPAISQTRGVEMSYGRWWHGDGGAASVVSVSLTRSWFGPFAWGIGINHASDNQSFVNRSITGAEVSLKAGGIGQGVYGVGAVGIGRQHANGHFDGQWSFGLGYGHEALSFLRLTGEVRYRLEDQLIKGFWNLDPADRSGIMFNVGAALRFGRSGVMRPTPPPTRPPVRRPPPAESPPPANGAREPGRMPALSSIGRLPGRAGGLANEVVTTALDAMGAPYLWGGTDDNGFDCSGLIQYAYAEHGIIIPRVSRDQARHGEYIEPRVENLRPGDILGFAITRGRVSHVGLYVGSGQFIHSSSSGVTLSSLTETDGDSRWYQQRWVVARRMLN